MRSSMDKIKAVLFLAILVLPFLVLAQTDYDKAEQLFQKKNYESSRVLFESYLKQNPNHLKTIEYLGDIQGAKQNWDKTLYYYSMLRKTKPQDANYQYKYGGALGMVAKNSNKFKALGMIGEVRSSFEKAIQINPKHLEARWALIEYYLQLPAMLGGSESKATQYATELSKLSTVDGFLAKGHIAVHFERYTNAEINYKKAFEIGQSKVAYDRLYDLYLNKFKDVKKAAFLKQQYTN
jgi:tetratricopeptide (TPR) repeat protein